MNNPLMYTDPNGENPLLIAMAAGAIMNVLLNAPNIRSVGDFLTAAGTGALAGAVGYGAGAAVAGAVGTIGFAGGALTGSAAGVAGGFVGSASDTWLSGAGFNAGLKAGLYSAAIGAVTGGIMGGISGIIEADAMGANLWDGSIIHEFTGSGTESEFIKGYNGSSFAASNDEVLKIELEQQLGFKEGQYNIKDVSTQPDADYSVRSLDGYYINNKTKALVYGYSEKPRFKGGFTKIRISPGATFGNPDFFKAVAGHELTHAYHFYAFKVQIYGYKKGSPFYIWNNSKGGIHRTEMAAYRYSNLMFNGNNHSYFSFWRRFMTDPMPSFPFVK